MPKFSREYLRQATNPGMFGLGVMGLGEQLGTALQSRRARDAQMQMMTLGNQALSASEQGDMQALDMRRQQLMELLSKTTNAGARDNIINAINQINAARPATQARATTNKAQSIIQTEQALKDMKAERESLQVTDEQGQVQLSGVFTSGQDRAMQALEDRLAVMKQDGQAVAEADSIKYQAKYQSILKENQLAEQQEVAGRRALSSVSFGSEQYKKISKRLKDSGFGDTVDKYEKDQYDLQAARAEADELRKSRAPLTAKEKETLKSYGFEPGGPDDISRDRKNLARIIEREAEDKIRIASAENARIANAGILAHVKSTLQTIQEQGDLPFNLFDDLYNKIEDLTDEDMQALADQLRRPAGEELTEAQIQQEVIEFVQRKFPEQWKAATQRQENIAEEAALVDVLTADLLVNSGLATRSEDGTVDLSGVSEENIRAARKEAERRRAFVPVQGRSVKGFSVRDLRSN